MSTITVDSLLKIGSNILLSDDTYTCYVTKNKVVITLTKDFAVKKRGNTTSLKMDLNYFKSLDGDLKIDTIFKNLDDYDVSFIDKFKKIKSSINLVNLSKLPKPDISKFNSDDYLESVKNKVKLLDVLSLLYNYDINKDYRIWSYRNNTFVDNKNTFFINCFIYDYKDGDIYRILNNPNKDINNKVVMDIGGYGIVIN